MNTSFVVILFVVIFLFIFAWSLCAGADSDIGIDEDAEQDEWLRAYQKEHTRKIEQKKIHREKTMRQIKNFGRKSLFK